MTPFERPPIGFIIEGYGEHESYPSLVCNLLGVPIRVPCSVNPNGCGQIFDRLGQELTALVNNAHPFGIIVTVDLGDFKKRCPQCDKVISHLQKQADEWLAEQRANGLISDLPESIAIVLQIKKIEGWLSSDEKSLAENGFLVPNYTPKHYQNTDTELRDPYAHLKRILASRDPKKPKHAKEIVSVLDLSTLENQSRSFRKFAKEVRRSYDLWANACATLIS